jgi:hypothetical protein
MSSRPLRRAFACFLLVSALVPVGALVPSCANVIGLDGVDRVPCVLDCGLEAGRGTPDARRDGPATKSEGGQPDASHPDGGSADGAQPDGEGGQPDGASPEGSGPDGSHPDGSVPDGSSPDGGKKDTGPPPTYTIGGTVSGLPSGDSVVLQDNGKDDLTVIANGSFTFATALASGAAYSVTVSTTPPAETCLVGSGAGTVASADVSSVVVTCSPSPTVVSFPTTTSVCAGPDSPGALGAGGGGARYQVGDSVSQAYARAASSTKLVLDFTMSDETGGCAVGATLTWNVQLNGTVVGSYSWVTAAGSTHTVSQTYSYAAIAPVAGMFTIEAIATSTVCSGGGSWNWTAGGTATIE